MDKIIVSNIQRFSLHDGPGIRTTVFLKGCSLHCPWCSNPENISGQYLVEGTESIIKGKLMTSDDVFNEVVKDKLYYYEDGGVTFSGGEPLLQVRTLLPLFKQLKENGIHQCVETCGFVEKGCFEEAIQYIDMFYVDIKILDQEKCRTVLGGNIKEYYSNLELLKESKVRCTFRIPMIGNYVATRENLNLILHLLRKLKPETVELLEAHNLGASKYQLLKKDIPMVQKADKNLRDWFISELEGIGVMPIELKL